LKQRVDIPAQEALIFVSVRSIGRSPLGLHCLAFAKDKGLRHLDHSPSLAFPIDLAYLSFLKLTERIAK
jgi:hypothetical protein